NRETARHNEYKFFSNRKKHAGTRWRTRGRARASDHGKLRIGNASYVRNQGEIVCLAETSGQTGDTTLHFQENGDKRYITEVHRENPVRKLARAHLRKCFKRIAV